MVHKVGRVPNADHADACSYTLTATHELPIAITFQGIQNEDGTVSLHIAVVQLIYLVLTCTASSLWALTYRESEVGKSVEFIG